MDYADYSPEAVEDIVRLRRRLDAAQVPPRRTDHNVVIGTWNIRTFGGVRHTWGEDGEGPRRNYRGLACIAEIIKRFDVVALQEVKRNTSGLRTLLDDFLGPDWGVILSDVSAGSKGIHERLAYVYDRRRVTPSGLAGEIVLPTGYDGEVAEQFDRTPYIVGFRAKEERFSLLTVHIRYGSGPSDRVGELRRIAEFAAEEIRDRARKEGAEESNLILLGDFNIDKRGDNPLFEAFVSTGLTVPPPLRDVKTTYGKEAKHYDQIAWFMGEDFDLITRPSTDDAGGNAPYAGFIDFVGAVYPELTAGSMTYRVSDHFPLWVEFLTDRSVEAMAGVLGVDANDPGVFDHVD